MCLMKLGTIVGHIPREFLRYFWLEVVEEYLVKIVEEGSMVKDWKLSCVHVHYYWSEENGTKDEGDAACEKWML